MSCSTVNMASRVAVYESADGLDVESTEHYEVFRRRVLFEDVLLVTYHRETGWPYILAHAFIAFIFFFIGGMIFAANASVVAAAIFAAIGLPSLALILARLALKVDVVTVFGRRSKATIRFPWRKRRAREAYGRICSRVRQVQQQVGAENPEAEVAPAYELPPRPILSTVNLIGGAVDRRHARVAGGRREQEDGAQAVRVQRGLDVAGALGGQVRQQHVVDPRGLRVRREPLDAVAHDRIEIRERDQRDFARRAHRVRDGEDLAHGRAALQRALRRGLDDRPVSDGIGERHAELDGVRAGIGQREDDVGGRAVAAGDVGDEAAAALAAQAFEECFDAVRTMNDER